MTGGSNTLEAESTVGPFKMSWMVNCQFSDQTPNGPTNWAQYPSPLTQSNAYLSLAPHSGILVRVPMPPSGQRRRVAVLCQSAPSGWRQSPRWMTPFGRGVMRLFIRTLPKASVTRLLDPPPVLLKVWCDCQLTNQSGNLNQQ
jgi:hypothetical protein